MMKRNKHIKIKLVIFFIILVIILLICISVSSYFGKRVETYSNTKATQKASQLISQVINSEVLELLEIDNLIEIGNKKVTINTVKLNRIIKACNETLVNKTNDLVIESITIPYSILFSEVMLPWSKKELTVKLKQVSSYEIDILNEVSEYGINNSLFTIHLIIKVDIQILIPLNVKEIEVVSKIPLLIQIIEGDVPFGVVYGGTMTS